MQLGTFMLGGHAVPDLPTSHMPPIEKYWNIKQQWPV